MTNEKDKPAVAHTIGDPARDPCYRIVHKPKEHCYIVEQRIGEAALGETQWTTLIAIDLNQQVRDASNPLVHVLVCELVEVVQAFGRFKKRAAAGDVCQ